MCIGVPMVVIEDGGDFALCEDHAGQRAEVDMRLVGAQAPGTWLLTFMNAARSVMDAVEAQQVADALRAVALALNGESIDHLFADLIDREPQLPDFAKQNS